jgi:hypothetical protein
MIKNLALIFALVIGNQAIAVSDRLKISPMSKADYEREVRAKNLLEELVVKYGLEKYFFTNEIFIRAHGPAHSHPLTLNTRTIDSPERFMGVFIHEQIHHLLKDRQEPQLVRFIELIERDFPSVPSEEEGGAKTKKSTYLHLAVCYFEFQELAKLIGSDEAAEIFRTEPIYFWIRQQVLENSSIIERALAASGIVWEYASIAATNRSHD